VIVVDASAVLEVVLRTPAAAAVERGLHDIRDALHAPQIIDVEVAHVIRRLAHRAEIAVERGWLAPEAMADFPVRRYSHTDLLPRIWALRHNLSAYDAAYVALAEALGAPLATRDRRLAGSSGHRARIELV
jgi:predicted nucleic acid-binding protein